MLEDSDLLIGLVASLEYLHDVPDPDAHLHDQMQKVLHRFPGYTEAKINHMADMSAATRGGYINQLQGYLGEQEIADLINSGAIPVPKGYHAVLSGTTNDPGVDFRLVDGHGHTVLGQCKVGMSKQLVTEHFLHHPDIQIVITNSELADQFLHDPGVTVLHAGDAIPEHAHRIVMDSGISHEHFRGFTTDFVNSGGHIPAHDSIWRKIPWIAAVVIGLRSAHEYTFSDTPEKEIANKAWRRLKDIFFATGAGEGLDFFVPGDHAGALKILSLLTISSFRVAKGNFARSADLAHANATFLSTFSPARPEFA